jgi:general stress protein 26
MTHDDNDAAHVHALVKDQRIAMLTTVAEDGSLDSRPMTLQQADPDGTYWFLALANSDPAEEMREEPRVNVAFTEHGKWVSVAGRAAVRHDPERARELWSEMAEAWFQREPDDPAVAVVRVDGESAQFWDGPGAVATTVSMLKALATGDRPDAGESGTTRL